MEYMVFEEEHYVRHAVDKLIENHREEYETLAEDALGKEIDQLHIRIKKLKDQVLKLEQLNPGRVHVPALTKTANELQKENERLARDKS